MVIVLPLTAIVIATDVVSFFNVILLAVAVVASTFVEKMAITGSAIDTFVAGVTPFNSMVPDLILVKVNAGGGCVVKEIVIFSALTPLSDLTPLLIVKV